MKKGLLLIAATALAISSQAAWAAQAKTINLQDGAKAFCSPIGLSNNNTCVNNYIDGHVDGWWQDGARSASPFGQTPSGLTAAEWKRMSAAWNNDRTDHNASFMVLQRTVQTNQQARPQPAHAKIQKIAASGTKTPTKLTPIQLQEQAQQQEAVENSLHQAYQAYTGQQQAQGQVAQRITGTETSSANLLHEVNSLNVRPVSIVRSASTDHASTAY